MNPMARLSVFIVVFAICLSAYMVLPFLYPTNPLSRWFDAFENPAANFIFFLVISLALSCLSTKVINAVFSLFRYRRVREPKIGEILRSLDLISEEDLKKALRIQNLRLGEILVEFGRITPEQRDYALHIQKTQKNRKIGEILKELGYSTEEDIRWALNRAHRKLGKTLNKLKMVNDYDITCAMSLKKACMIDREGRIIEKTPEPIFSIDNIIKKGSSSGPKT